MKVSLYNDFTLQDHFTPEHMNGFLELWTWLKAAIANVIRIGLGVGLGIGLGLGTDRRSEPKTT